MHYPMIFIRPNENERSKKKANKINNETDEIRNEFLEEIFEDYINQELKSHITFNKIFNIEEDGRNFVST